MKSAELLVLLLGGNMPDTSLVLEQTASLLANYFGVPTQRSAVYASEAWGFQAPSFLNQALVFHTLLSPQQCLQHTQQVEKRLGRQHKTQNGQYQNRVIDIDIIFYGQQIVNEPNLQIPHPLMQKRRFVLMPLTELLPHFIHPVLQKDVGHLYHTCTDKAQVHALKPNTTKAGNA